MALHNGKFIKTTDVVISGISGAFPQSESIEELKQNLLSGKDMITHNDRWNAGIDDPSRKLGMLKTLDRFDSSFFRMGRQQAEAMNISNRILMEKVFEAILDAGYNPQQFKGTNTGVFVGFWLDETDGAEDNAAELGEYAAYSYLRCLTANRISYWLDLHGPSFILDTACSTGLYLLEMAYKAIQNGNCDAAIVCTVNLCVQPIATDTLRSMGVISLDGINRPFDADGNLPTSQYLGASLCWRCYGRIQNTNIIKPFNTSASGFVRGEAVVATVLQKKEHARRIYANVVHAKTNCDGYTIDGIFYPSADGQSDLFRRFYQEIDVDPTDVTYIEAHGTIILKDLRTVFVYKTTSYAVLK